MPSSKSDRPISPAGDATPGNMFSRQPTKSALREVIVWIAIASACALTFLGCEEVIEVEEPPGASSEAAETSGAFSLPRYSPSPSATPVDTPSSAPATEEPATSETSEREHNGDAGVTASTPRQISQPRATQSSQAAVVATENSDPETNFGDTSATVEEAPPPAPEQPPTPQQPPPTSAPVITTQPASTPSPSNCDPSYPDVCIPIGAADYDCAGGGGNGPNYISGTIRVLPPDPHKLDRDGDGFGCEPRPSPQ